MATPQKIYADLSKELRKLSFAEPVTHVYDPLQYAKAAHDMYLSKYGEGQRELILLGMNPGPWGMAQTGVPFGEVHLAKDWLKIDAPIEKPKVEHPKRPIEGFDCQRSEVSGRRLWGWAKDKFVTPAAFFSKFFIANYCPLVFMEASGKNRTPDKLPVAERGPLIEICDRALARIVDYYQPKMVIGVGAFAETRAKKALVESDVAIGRILHPSPASPIANKGWAERAEKDFESLGISL